jgi:hypothetical protein
MKISRVLAAISSFSLALGTAFLLTHLTLSQTASPVSGWIWSGTTDNTSSVSCASPLSLSEKAGCGSSGWISFSSSNTGNGASYAVSLPAGDGDVMGYLWSSNLGWINFQPTSGFPSYANGDAACKFGFDNNALCPQHGVRRIGNSLVGWARLESIANGGVNTGGWSGWLKLGPGLGKYGATLDVNGNLGGFAWSPELGYLNLSGKIDTVPPPPACGNGTCSASLGETCLSCPVDCGTCPPPPPGITCSGSPSSGKKVTWTASGSAVPPYTWVFSQDANPPTGSGSSVEVTYASNGTKTATVTSSDGAGNTCSATASEFNIKEILPFF